MVTREQKQTILHTVLGTFFFGTIATTAFFGYIDSEEEQNKKTYNSKEQVWSSVTDLPNSSREFMRVEVGNNALEATVTQKSRSWVFLDDQIDGALDFVAVFDYNKYPLYFSIKNNPEEIKELQQVFETVKSKAYSHIPPSYDLIQLMRRNAEK